MTTTALLIVAIAWIVGAIIAYNAVFKKGYDYPLWYSIFWPVVIPLWLIHAIHKK